MPVTSARNVAASRRASLSVNERNDASESNVDTCANCRWSAVQQRSAQASARGTPTHGATAARHSRRCNASDCSLVANRTTLQNSCIDASATVGAPSRSPCTRTRTN